MVFEKILGQNLKGLDKSQMKSGQITLQFMDKYYYLPKYHRICRELCPNIYDISIVYFFSAVTHAIFLCLSVCTEGRHVKSKKKIWYAEKKLFEMETRNKEAFPKRMSTLYSLPQLGRVSLLLVPLTGFLQ